MPDAWSPFIFVAKPPIGIFETSKDTALSNRINLQAYLARIEYHEKLDTSIRTLNNLHARHVATFPFENLDVLLGRGISIELADIEDKFIKQGRGGYCFEQNSLFAAVLKDIGFQITPLIARVRWQVPVDRVTPLSHMVLKVETDQGSFQADVGFGGVGLIHAISFETDTVQHRDFEPRRLVNRGSVFVQQIQIGETWEDVYQFEPKAVEQIDLEVANWYSHSHPHARFRQDLVATLANAERRILLVNTELTIRTHGGKVEKRSIYSREMLLEVLAEEFLLRFAKDTEFVCPNLILD